MSALPRPQADRAAPPRSVARTHVGTVRRINEDRVFDWPEGGLWAVADGMGGHRGGDLAAEAVVEALRALAPAADRAAPDVVLHALEAANRQIFARNLAAGEQAGATVVTLCRDGTTAHVAWAGDSRCYRVRDGNLDLLTRDHSVVQDLIEVGLLTPATAAHHPQANVITRALGIAGECAIDRTSVPIRPGDRFLLCSDGLSRSLTEADAIDPDIATAADRLLAQALHRDGSDNISLVLVAFDD